MPSPASGSLRRCPPVVARLRRSPPATARRTAAAGTARRRRPERTPGRRPGSGRASPPRPRTALVEHAFGQRQRDEEPAVGTGRHRVRHVRVERREARVEARRVQRLQTLDLRRQQPAPAPLVGDALRDVAGRDVGVLRRPFASVGIMSGRPIMKPVRTPGAISLVNELMMQRALRRQLSRASAPRGRDSAAAGTARPRRSGSPCRSASSAICAPLRRPSRSRPPDSGSPG